MKLKVKRSTGGAAGVLDAAEQTYAPDLPDSEDYPYNGPRQPAPAGSLHRGYRPGNFAEDGDDLTADSPFHNSSGDDRDYVPRRGRSLLQQRLRRMPGSVAGRVILGSFFLILLGAVVVGAAAVRYFVLHDARFRIASADNIEVTGDTHLTRDQVLAVFAPDLQRSIFNISLPERRADVERLPWVQHATVMRLLPNTVRVAITERTPVAFARQGTQLGLVDASGVLLDMPAADAGDPQYSFPVLTGVTAAQTPAERAGRMQLYRRFMTDLPPAAAEGLSEVDVTDPEDVKAVIPSGGGDLLVHFGEDNFDQRYQDFQGHLTEWRQQYPRLASADMRYQGQVVLEMKQGSTGEASEGAVTSPVNLAVASPTPAAPPAAAPSPTPTPIAVTPPTSPRGPSSRAPTTPARVSTDDKGAKGWGASTAGVPSLPSRPATAKPVATLAAAKHVPKATPKPTLKTAKATKPTGRSASNERMFAALAAQRRANEAKAHATSGGAR